MTKAGHECVVVILAATISDDAGGRELRSVLRGRFDIASLAALHLAALAVMAVSEFELVPASPSS
jgi:hypothetical protein